MSRCSCKVGRAIETYELAGFDDEIRRRREREDASLRTLAAFLNTRILRRVTERHADRNVVADAGSIYATLTGPEDAGAAAELRERLASLGVPVDDVTDDFISHQTMRAHLNDCLDVDTGRTQATDVEEVTNLIEWARSRDERIIDRALTRLRELGELDVGRWTSSTPSGCSVRTVVGHTECRAYPTPAAVSVGATHPGSEEWDGRRHLPIPPAAGTRRRTDLRPGSVTSPVEGFVFGWTAPSRSTAVTVG
jgi:hypothetical protein